MAFWITDDVQQSSILRRLNKIAPPSTILRALNRVDPFPSITGTCATDDAARQHRAAVGRGS